MVFDARAAGISFSIASITPQRMPMSRFAAQRLARVEHVATLDHQVELVVRPHRGVGVSGDPGNCGRPGQAARKSRRENPLMAALPQYDFYAAMMRRRPPFRKQGVHRPTPSQRQC